MLYNTIFYSFFMPKCRINLYDICHTLELGLARQSNIGKEIEHISIISCANILAWQCILSNLEGTLGEDSAELVCFCIQAKGLDFLTMLAPGVGPAK